MLDTFEVRPLSDTPMYCSSLAPKQTLLLSLLGKLMFTAISTPRINRYHVLIRKASQVTSGYKDQESVGNGKV
jgi:hypothetical protein